MQVRLQIFWALESASRAKFEWIASVFILTEVYDARALGRGKLHSELSATVILKPSSLCLETRGCNFKFVVIVPSDVALTAMINCGQGPLPRDSKKSLSGSLSSTSLVVAFNLSNSSSICCMRDSLFISTFSFAYRFSRLRRSGRLACFARGVALSAAVSTQWCPSANELTYGKSASHEVCLTECGATGPMPFSGNTVCLMTEPW